jgi:hypothetical protein
VKRLKSELDRLQGLLANAEQYYLPVWAVPYYDHTLSTVAKYHREVRTNPFVRFRSPLSQVVI